MNDIIKNIVAIIFCFAVTSCVTEEPFEPVKESSSDREVEFVLRPTNFTKSSPSTKSTEISVEPNDLESKVFSAYFLMYDSNGKLVRYENLTDTITDDGDVPSQTIVTDNSLNNVTVCYLANLPESYVKSNMAVSDGEQGTDLNKLKSAVIDFKNDVIDFKFDKVEESGCVGLPAIDVDDDSNTDREYCFPMMGIWTGNLTGLSGDTVIDISVKRLFAKVAFTVDLQFADASFDIESIVVKNIPKYIPLYPSENELALSDDDDDKGLPYYGTTNFLQRNYNEIPNVVSTIQSGNSKTFYFYVPEYIVDPILSEGVMNQQWYKQRLEEYKPELIGNKKAINVELNGTVSKQGQNYKLVYTIYLGENQFDNFSVKRNCLYDNQVKIYNVAQGAFGADHRVKVDYDGFVVGFQRATLLDSHYEVRPLRVQFSDKFITENQNKPADLQGGAVTIQILNGDDGTLPEWLRLERPVITEGNAMLYSPKGQPSPTKRRYFTTNLVTETLKDNIVVSYNPFDASTGDLKGDVPTWLYVDEFLAGSEDEYAKDAVRVAKIRVTYTPKDEGDQIIHQDFTVEQRAIYPIVSKAVDDKIYGIEFFEEYQHNYDDDLNYDNDGGVYHSNYEGMEWGFNGITLSRNNKAMYLDKALASLGAGTDPKAEEGFDKVTLTEMKNNLGSYITSGLNSSLASAASPIINTIIENIDLPSSIADLTIKQIFQILLDEIMTPMVAKFDAFYDYYAAADDNTGFLSNIDTREYEGYEMNVEIIHNLLEKLQAESTDEDLSKVLLNGFTLNKSNPLSAIAYCYNKNKRDENGNVVTLSGDYNQTVNIENLHWYAPCIEEIEDIMTSAHELEEEFSVFTEKFYWSCQPAYHINEVDITYNADAMWNDQKIARTGTILGFIPKYDVVSEAERPVKFHVDGSGSYYVDDPQRARATRYNLDDSEPISSSVEGIYAKLATQGSDDFGKIDGIVSQQFYLTLASEISDSEPTWNPANPEHKPTGAELTYHEGNNARAKTNRIRCIYNPNPPKTATRTTGENGGFTYTYSYE